MDRWNGGYEPNILVIGSWSYQIHNQWFKNYLCDTCNENRHECLYVKTHPQTSLIIRDGLLPIIPALPKYTTLSLLAISSTHNILKFLILHTCIHTCAYVHIHTHKWPCYNPKIKFYLSNLFFLIIPSFYNRWYSLSDLFLFYKSSSLSVFFLPSFIESVPPKTSNDYVILKLNEQFLCGSYWT